MCQAPSDPRDQDKEREEKCVCIFVIAHPIETLNPNKTKMKKKFEM